MKLKCYISFVLFLITSFSWASISFDDAIQLIEKKKYTQGSEILDSLIQKDPYNAAYYYNYGFSEYHAGNIGKAIWSFEKTLQLDPKNDHVLHNLELCSQKLELPGYQPIESTFMRSLYKFGSNSWAVVGLILIVVVALSLIRYKKASIKQRKTILVATPVLFIFMLFSLYVSYAAKEYQTHSDFWIVTDKNVATYIDVNATGPVKIGEGNRVKEVGKVNEEFSQFELPNGQLTLLKTTQGLKKL